MLTEEKALQIKPLLESEDFRKEMMNTQTAEEICQLFQKHGTIVDYDDLKDITDAMEAALPENADELSEDDLENVAGGCVGTVTLILLTGAVIVISVVALAIMLKKFKRVIKNIKGK